MKKTMKMSNFFLTIGLGCMLIYVLLHAFNIPIREGMKYEIPEPKPEDIQKFNEKGEAWSKGLEKQVEQLKTQLDYGTKLHPDKMIIWDKCKKPFLELLEVRKNEKLLHLKMHFNKTIPGPSGGMTEEAKTMLKDLRDIFDLVKFAKMAGNEIDLEEQEEEVPQGIDPKMVQKGKEEANKEKKDGWF